MKVSVFRFVLMTVLPVIQASSARSAELAVLPLPGDRIVSEYFRAETRRLADDCLDEIQTLADWNSRKALYRQQLFEMLGLSPLPERRALEARVTGRIYQPHFTVEKLHFQPMPGLYVTANLYLPRELAKPAPAVLYVCGHARVVKDGISYGNKTGYQHHGAWFAQNGYVCLIIDTVQLGEIEGIHHGTYREGMWWWNARGYTSAGVEAWNGIRALDYLQSRPEVDPERLGVTGRSGGGAYSWWLVALDDRVKVAAPVAGITDLQNHVVDGVVEGHCDCMFIVNTYRWDYAQVAALAAPRPLLIANSDKDSIFPLDGVSRVHQQVRRIYQLHGAANHLGLLITEGPHRDTQDLQVPVFRWFNRFLKEEDSLIEMAAIKYFDPEELKVFDQLPVAERTSKIHETFVAAAESPSVPATADEWSSRRQDLLQHLGGQVFGGWPKDAPPIQMEMQTASEQDGLRVEVCEFTSQNAVRLPIVIVRPAGKLERVELEVAAAADWNQWRGRIIRAFPRLNEASLGAPSSPDQTASAMPMESGDSWLERLQRERIAQVIFPPRGIGPTQWNQTERKQVQIRRRFMLLGQTLDGMRVWDIRRALGVLGRLDSLRGLPVHARARGSMGVNALYAALFEPSISALDLAALPLSHRAGPDYLNVLRFLDIPQTVALVAERTPIVLREANETDWNYPRAVARSLRWDVTQLQIRGAPAAAEPSH